MSDSSQLKTIIQTIITKMMDKLMKKVLITDPFIPENHHASKPLYAALVPDEIFKGSHFERRFVTPFGRVWEELALAAAKEGLGEVKPQHSIQGKVKSERLHRINEVLRSLEHPDEDGFKPEPNWEEELSYIMEGDGEDIPVTVLCDFFAVDNNTKECYAFEIKAPLPNSDQTKVSKEKLLKLYAMEPQQIDFGYFALPYNPYGKKEDYTWSFPNRWFNMKDDKVVLIGGEFWDKIGGLGTYDAFISAVNEIGLDYKNRIYREFLGIEPPEKEIDFKLQ